MPAGYSQESWEERADPRFGAGFRLDRAGPRLVFTLRWRGEWPAYLAAHGDRAAGRSADYDVVGQLDGHQLVDPAAGAESSGGPVTAVVLPPDAPWRHELALADHVVLPPHPVGELVVRCRRRLGIGATPDLALAAHPVVVEAELRVLLG